MDATLGVGTYDLEFTAYVDGITQGEADEETRLPFQTMWHLNLYQQEGDFLQGDDVLVRTRVSTWKKASSSRSTTLCTLI
jgi:hypothetical protein